MKEILVDIETYSEVDIGKCGLYRYATDLSFEILLIAWATDEGAGFGETKCADLASGETIPMELLEAFQSGSVRLIAHNAAFERVCFSVHLKLYCPKVIFTGTFFPNKKVIAKMQESICEITVAMAAPEIPI